MTVRFDQLTANGSEGNIAAVCASAAFPESVQKGYEEVKELLTVDISVLEGSAGMYIMWYCDLIVLYINVYFVLFLDVSDYGSVPSTISFNLSSFTRCFQIQITNDSVSEGVETFTLKLSHNTSSRNIIDNNAILIPSRTDEVLIRILESCYNGEIRLRGGFDVYQGRVEICYNGVWGTVCDDGVGWQNGSRVNAQVICKQLGLQSQGKL